jgi:hypothetical protein
MVMIFTKKLNNVILIIQIFLFSLYILSCSKKDEQKKNDIQSTDTVKSNYDSITTNGTSKVSALDVKKKFDEIKRKYESELDVIGNKEVRFVDLDNNGVEEAILYYSLVAKGGNAMTGSGIILYKIEGSKLEFLLDYNLDGAVVKSIKDGELNCVKYEYVAGDPNCCPSKKKPFKLKYQENKLFFVP